MKKLLGLLLLAGILFSSCDTSEDPVEEFKPNSFKFTVDGVEKDFSADVKVEYDDIFGTEINATSGSEVFTIYLRQTATGTYTQPEEYTGFDNGLRFTSGAYSFKSIYSSSLFEIEVTDFQGDGNVVAGSFTGTLKYIDMDDLFAPDSNIVITGGEFYVSK